MLTLDVGCGIDPKGDINIDLFPEKTLHRAKATNMIDVHKVPNFVKADIHYLPFQNDIFDTVFCMAVLEHRGVDFWKGLAELLRVSKDIVLFQVPHRFHKTTGSFQNYRHPTHDKWFSKKWLIKNLKEKGYFYTEMWYELTNFPHFILPILVVPRNIFVTLTKDKRNVNRYSR